MEKKFQNCESKFNGAMDNGIIPFSNKIFILHGCTHRSTKGKRATFTIDHENKSVTCHLSCTAAIRDKHSKISKLFDLFIPKKDRKIKTTITIKCNDEDKFDENFGKQLAFAKARVSCLKTMKSLIERFFSQINEVCTDFKTETDRYDVAISQHSEDYKSLIDNKYSKK